MAPKVADLVRQKKLQGTPTDRAEVVALISSNLAKYTQLRDEMDEIGKDLRLAHSSDDRAKQVISELVGQVGLRTSEVFRSRATEAAMVARALPVAQPADLDPNLQPETIIKSPAEVAEKKKEARIAEARRVALGLEGKGKGESKSASQKKREKEREKLRLQGEKRARDEGTSKQGEEEAGPSKAPRVEDKPSEAPQGGA